MDRRSFRQLMDSLDQCSRVQLRQLAERALAGTRRGRAAEVIEAARAPLLACPRCAGTKLYRDGHANGLQRFRCRACGRTFNCLTGTPLARLRLKDKWLGYCDTLLDPVATVRKSAERLGVHRTTAFRWRHRMLAWPQHDAQAPLQGIVEADEMYVPESFKGARQLPRPARHRGAPACKRDISNEQVCMLLARDRSGRTHDAVQRNGPITSAQLTASLKPALGTDVLLVTHARPIYADFAREHGISHETVKVRSGEPARGAIHVHNVVGYQSRLRVWLHHFRGVASHYLANYCGWRRAIDGQRIHSPEAFLRAAVGVFRS